uniref:hypothetical protein n=1 Tax=Aliarcobacter sp. TaxID=2321116 RepID=UPI004047B973
MVLPTFLVEKIDDYFDAYFSKVSLFTQKTLEQFMKEGHWDKHLRKIRTLNKKKHNIMRDCLKKYIGDSMQIIVQGGGLSIIINPTVPFDFDKLEKLAKKEQIKIYFTKGDWKVLRMGFGGFKEDEIENAVIAFSTLWNKCFI